MTEPKELAAARAHLAKAEAALMSEDGLFHLHEGLGFLEAIIGDHRAAAVAAVARNLGQTYASRIFERVERDVGKSDSTEPQLEHAFALLRTFDEVGFDLPERAGALKVEIVRRLLDFYSEGGAPADRERLRAQLAQIARDHGQS
jgi:hypothetical protein